MGNIPVEGGDSSSVNVPIRRRNTKGISTDNISMTIPKELNQTINRIAVRDSKTRSRVIAELIEKGLSK